MIRVTQARGVEEVFHADRFSILALGQLKITEGTPAKTVAIFADGAWLSVRYEEQA